MMCKMNKTRSKMDSVREYIEKGNISSKIPSEIESFISQYIAVAFYAEVEERISDIIRSFLESCSNECLAYFLEKNMANIISRVSKSDIVKLIRLFGEELKDEFNNRVEDSTSTLYGNVIVARHNIGHKDGSQITFPELERGLESAEKILEALHSCLNRRRSENSD